MKIKSSYQQWKIYLYFVLHDIESNCGKDKNNDIINYKIFNNDDWSLKINSRNSVYEKHPNNKKKTPIVKLSVVHNILI